MTEHRPHKRSDHIDDQVCIGYNANGTVDEIVLYDKDGRCLFHMEQMDNHWHWFAIYGSQKEVRGQVGKFNKHQYMVRITEIGDKDTI